MKFEHRKSKKNGQFYFKFRGDNGETMFPSEGYKRRATMLKSIAALKAGVATAEIVDLDELKAKPKRKLTRKSPLAEHLSI